MANITIPTTIINGTPGDDTGLDALIGTDPSGLFSGEDLINGGEGNDTIDGRGGDDCLNGDQGDDLIYGREGDDTIQGGQGLDRLFGGDGEDTLNGGNGNDVLYGNDGADIMNGGNDNDTMYGDAGDDIMNGGNGNDYMRGGTGDDIMRGGTGDDTMEGLADNDQLFGNGGDDILRGNEGEDRLDGGTGNDTMEGGSGDDSYVVDSLNDQVVELAGEGIDIVLSRVDGYSLTAETENLRLDAGIISGGGNDLANTIEGNAENNTLRGRSGNDTLFGFGGNDVLFGGAGIDSMHGGQGNDRYFVNSLLDSTVEGFNQGIDTVSSSVNGWTLDANIENLILRGNAVSGIGNELNNILRGNANNNVLEGRDGDDTLIGGGGNDTMIGGQGNDRYFAVPGETIIEEFDQGIDTVLSSVNGYILGDNLENLTLLGSVETGTGNELDNTIRGNASNNFLQGRDGNDTLLGGDGDDILGGGFQNDLLVGGRGNDSLFGDQGDDILNGFGQAASAIPQIDVLTGGSGADVYVLGGASWGVSYFEAGDGHAVINTFDRQESDRIQVRDPAALGGGFYSLEFGAVLGATGAVNNNIHDTEVYFTNASGVRDRIAIVQDTINVNIASDFVFV